MSTHLIAKGGIAVDERKKTSPIEAVVGGRGGAYFAAQKTMGAAWKRKKKIERDTDEEKTEAKSNPGKKKWPSGAGGKWKRVFVGNPPIKM